VTAFARKQFSAIPDESHLLPTNLQQSSVSTDSNYQFCYGLTFKPRVSFGGRLSLAACEGFKSCSGKMFLPFTRGIGARE